MSFLSSSPQGVSSTCCCSGALLFDARQLFEQQNAKADEALRSIVGQLPEAVTSCVDAAGADMDPIRQAALMKVATFLFSLFLLFSLLSMGKSILCHGYATLGSRC